jgi:hypothetical protein
MAMTTRVERTVSRTRVQRRHRAAPTLERRGHQTAPAAGLRGTAPALLHGPRTPVQGLDPSAILALQAMAGNQAVSSLLAAARVGPVQRAVGWKSDASGEGHGWNAGERSVGSIRRIPLEGLTQGLQQDTAKRWVRDGKGGHWEDESTMIEQLSPESAKGRAIVLVPQALRPEADIEVLIHLHGYTESAGRPYAGWRELTPAAAGTKDRTLHQLRQGVDQDDVAPVRDVALDRAEQQLQDSGYAQTVIVLPQGGLHSQFGRSGDYNFDSGKYVENVVSRLVTDGVWRRAPNVARVSMAGHSGAGATLAGMARESVRREAGRKPGASSTLTGDLVLLDAINTGSELAAFRDWALMRLDRDLAALKGMRSEAEKLGYLRTAQKLRGYHSRTGSYGERYRQLDRAIGGWFSEHAADLGPVAPCLRANFSIVSVPVWHEELMRGTSAGETRAGAGSILDALHALHPTETKVADCAAPAAAAPASAAPASKPRRSHPTRGSAAPASTAAPAAGEHHHSTPGTPDGRAKQIATAILLAKSGGEGQGKTPEARKAAKEAAEASVARDILTGTKKDVDAWFADFEPDAQFLGKRIRPSSRGEVPGVHRELAVRLRAAEDMLVDRKAGETPADAGSRLQVRDVAGLRVPKTPTGKTSGASMHCFGLAVDIDHDNNPFVGNADKPTKKRREGGASIQIIEHATLLLGGAVFDPLKEPPRLAGHQTDSQADREARAARSVEQWKLLDAASEQVKRYLSMTSTDLDAELDKRLPAMTAWQQSQTAEPAPAGKRGKHPRQPDLPPWAAQVTDRAWWHAQQQRDVRQSGSGDFGRGDTSDVKTHGFMTLREELVRALVLAGLTWGGVYHTDKDIMHFDLRTGSIGGRPVV